MEQVKQTSATIVSNVELMPDVYLLWAHAPDVAAQARPGQYVMVRCGEGYDMPLRRPLSIHRSSTDGGLALLFAVVGHGTEWLANRRKGERLDLLGPLGNGFGIRALSRNLLLVAGGVGIAPLVALAEQAVSNHSVTLLVGDKTATRIYPQRLLPHGVETVVVTEDGSAGLTGTVCDILPGFVSDADQVFACGPLAMYREMAAISRSPVGKPTQVLLEAVLGCGFGACLSCTVETAHGRRLVCKDGPVFEFDDILWDKMAAPPTGRRCL